MPYRVELLMRIGVKVRFELGSDSVFREFDHFGVRVVPHRIEHESLIGIVPQPISNVAEVDPQMDLGFFIATRLQIANPMTLAAVQAGF